MSLRYRNSQGTETPVAGLNSTSCELVPSLALKQSGTATVTISGDLADYPRGVLTVTFDTAMPDADYQVEYVTVNAGAFAVVTTSKSATGFTAIVRNLTGGVVGGAEVMLKWSAFKLMTDTVHEDDAAHIAQNTANFAPAFSEVTSYAVGDYVTYNNILYRCTIAHTAGTWVAGHFTQATVGGSFTSFPDYAHPISIPNGANTWTATQDCYVTFFWATTGSVDYAVLYIDGNQVSVQDSGGTEKEAMFCGYVKKGHVISSLNVVLSSPTVKIYPLI